VLERRENFFTTKSLQRISTYGDITGKVAGGEMVIRRRMRMGVSNFSAN